MLAVGVAFAVGLCLSLIQVAVDLRNERRAIDDTVLEVLRTVEDSATQAAYTLDKRLGHRVLTGLFEFQPVYYAEILDDFGDSLARVRRPVVEAPLRWFAMLTFGEARTFELSLDTHAPSLAVGRLVVHVDPYRFAQPFFERAGLLLAGGIVRNLVLSLVLLAIFYVTLTKPLLTISRALLEGERSGSRDMRIPVPSLHRRDELGLIVDSFNDVLERRHRAESELKQHREKLEEMVRSRTEELEAAREEVRRSERLATIGQLVAIVSHELRNPLGTLTNNARMIKRLAGTDDERLHRVIESTQRNVRRCEVLIDDLLDLKQETPLRFEPLSLDDWLSTLR